MNNTADTKPAATVANVLGTAGLDQAKDRLARAMARMETAAKQRVTLAESRATQAEAKATEALARAAIAEKAREELLAKSASQNQTVISAELVRALQEEITQLKTRIGVLNQTQEQQMQAYEELEAASELAIDTLDMTIDELINIRGDRADADR
ncbi:MAG: hypothetical protein K0R63_629 [Rickettsiales bacterium]|jgi:phage shock protein A|nr:hypothetical protein [Rickettsiales bacterium]